ncbi:MAG: hypothetical protein JWM11_5523 [Planctomycetaceae bacterium]|nr:hypothetical protein [Planctomycetaceae bacterium]
MFSSNCLIRRELSLPFSLGRKTDCAEHLADHSPGGQTPPSDDTRSEDGPNVIIILKRLHMTFYFTASLVRVH